MKCDICGNCAVFGNKVAHNRMYIANRSPGKIKPDLHIAHIMTPQGRKKITVCTSFKGKS